MGQLFRGVICLLSVSQAACSYDGRGFELDAEEPGGAEAPGGGVGAPGPSLPSWPAGEGGEPAREVTCWYAVEAVEAAAPVAVVETALEGTEGAQALYVRLTLDARFVDNTYGKNAVGWPAGKKGGHKLGDLVNTDAARLTLVDGLGHVALELAVDYLSADAGAPSGYRSLGVTGGDGAVLVGPVDAVLAVSTSLDRNLNERGHAGFVVDSPPTDLAYAPPAMAPDWDFRVVYELQLAPAAFGAAGFGAVQLDAVQASPSKLGVNQLPVVPGACPGA